MKIPPTTILLLLVAFLLYGCPILVTRYHSEILDQEVINGVTHFRYATGAHLIEKTKKEHSVNRKQAIILLLEKELSERNLCENGYEILRESWTSNSDSSLDVICK